ncbi:amino acid adenylation domain-containing protein [Streptomyces sp. Li-HN-5-11]|uniref:non-ribosomal peptide synthetase n=1 Tax=Streptomyces sp. Li-HN-5-11 TaxID=3075432 RepID=UPI0028AA71E8|nr:amino acid adenylation domain-containing protein [Streptomyces sp. Li-HN-5-11]WNM30386.1 amino acid adenylation domain-containing protein [Streptomyces sp. Li-HN-5-11]
MSAQDIDGFGISPQQELAWRTARDHAGLAVPVTAAVELDGPLDLERLREAARGLTAEYEILRTALVLPEGHSLPVQVIAEQSEPGLEVEDLTGLSEAEQRRRIDAEVRRSRRAEGLLEAEPVSLRLLRTAPTRHLLLLRASAAVLDRAGAVLLVGELGRLYAGSRETAGDEPMQYADLAEWLKERAQEGRYEVPRFLKALTEPTAPARLPFEFAAGHLAEPAAGPGVVDLGELLPGEQTLTEWDCGLRELLHACWLVTLYRYTAAESTLTAFGEYGRRMPELATMLGPLQRLLPFPAEVDDDTPFRELVRTVSSAEVVCESDADLFDPAWWSRHGSDLTDRVRAFDLVDLGAPRTAGDLVFTPLAVYGAAPGAGLALSVHQSAPLRARAEILFAADRFETADVERLGQVFRRVLTHVVDHPDTLVGEVPVWEADPLPAAAGSDEDTVPGVRERFLRHASATPEATAVEDGRVALTYAALAERSARVAARLAEAGVGRGHVVPVLVGRGADVVVAMLAVWRTGAAFTVIDEAAPAGRIETILADTAAVAVVTDSALKGRLGERQTVRVVLDELPEEARAAFTDAAAPASGDPAYVVYTSGSTGTPKGVTVGHGALAHYVHAIGERHPATQGSVFAMVSTFAADLGYTAVFSALASGGQLSVVPTAAVTDAVALEDWLSARQVDCLKIVPSHLAALLGAAAHPELLLPRRLLVVGGEACPVSLVEQVRRLAPQCEMVNHYGPTETTVGVCTLPTAEAGADPRVATVPIGRPLPGMRAAVRDRAGRPVPPWMPGELYISGPQLADGYFNQPGATAERFVTAPVAGTAAERWYRTGDVVRSLPDGCLEYLGRADRQVKINGYRVDLQEIEGLLQRAPGVRECAVALVGDERLLTACVVHDDGEAAVERLRGHVRHFAPEYMLPKVFVFLDALPRTPNGKVDAAALRVLGESASRGAAALAPRDSVELGLLEVWHDLLPSAGRIGVTDNFFEVGGHSLLALQLLAEINRRLGHRLPISVLFEGGTVEAMARAVRAQGERSSRTLVPMRGTGSHAPVFCVHAGGGSVMGYLDLVRGLPADIPVHGLESVGLDGGRPPLNRVAEMAELYAEEINGLEWTGSCTLVGWGLGAVFAHAVAERLQALGRSVGTLVVIDGAAPDARALAEVEAGRSADEYYSGMLDTDVVERFARHYQLELPAGEPAEEQRALLARAMREKGLLAEDSPGRLESLFEVYRANIGAVQEHVRGFVPTQPQDTGYSVLLLRTDEELPGTGEDPALGWGSLVGDRVTVARFPGDHYEIMKPPIVDGLCAQIRSVLAPTQPQSER